MTKWFVLGLVFILSLFLRLYRVEEIPPALYWDEASLGYNAFSIATTLKDEHGRFLPHDYFTAFGDYKPIGYVYATVPFVKLLGLNETSVRLPSVLSGSLLVLITFFLVRELFFFLSGKSKDYSQTAIMAALFVGISPWSIQISRAAFESNLATLFSASGVLFFLVGIRKNSKASFAISAIAFVASMYTFNSHRVFVPLLILFLLIIFVKKLWSNKQNFFLFVLTLALLLLPLTAHLASPEGKLRFQEVTWLNNLNIIQISNQKIAENGQSIWANIVFNRRIYYLGEFAKHYFDHLNPSFLFISGDINTRFSSREMGQLYWADGVLIILGMIFLFKNNRKAAVLLLGWALLAPIPAAFARETPHALRTFNLLPVPMILSGVGLGWLVASSKKNLVKILILFVTTTIIYQLVTTAGNYLSSYPIKFSADWQYGYKQMVHYVASVQDKYDHIAVTGRLGRPYIYFLFYENYPPEKYWQNRDAQKDQFGFWQVRGFDKFLFGQDVATSPGKWLIIKDPGMPIAGSVLVKTIYDLDNHPVFEIYDQKIHN